MNCEAGSFFNCYNAHRFLQPEVLRLSFPVLEPRVAWFVSIPRCSSCFIRTNMGLPSVALPSWSLSCQLAMHTLLPGCPFPPLLPVWMNVSSLTPWLLDFLTIQFSGSSGCLLFLNLLLSFFWLCKEAKCIYLCLYLGRKIPPIF